MALGIERFIHLTSVNTSLDMELMSVVLKFWSKSINYFLLPFSPISITLRDNTILMSLPTDALCLLDIQDSSLSVIDVAPLDPTAELDSGTQTTKSIYL